MEQYIFDLKIAALMLGVEEDSLQALEFIRQYRDKIAQLLKTYTMTYFKAKGWEESRINEELQKLETQHIENSAFLEDYAFLDSLGRIQNEYNKKIYEIYRPKISQEQKDKINAYIKEIQDVTNRSFTQ